MFVRDDVAALAHIFGSLAPSDALPWPFEAVTPPAPSVFAPIELKPMEWRHTESGALVFGWKISG